MIDCGDGVRLRAIERADLEKMGEWLNRQPDGAFVGNQDFPISRGKVEQWYDRALAGDEEQMLAIEQGEDSMVGYLAFRVDWRHREGQIGAVLVAEPYRGRGIASRALRGLFRALFVRWRLNRIALGVHAANQAAMALYRSLGMKEEGRLRRKFHINGDWHDLILFALLHDEAAV